jgi:predicted nucleic acid-binding protein
LRYVDTSVVVQALDARKGEESGKASELLLTGEEKVISEVFLLELTAAFSRRDDLISAFASEAAAPSSAIVAAYVAYAMSKYGLKFLESSGEKTLTPVGRASAEVAAALARSGELKMRSLDLLHVSHLLCLKEKGYPIDCMITADKDFLKAEKLLEGLGVKVSIPGTARAP